MTVRIADEGKGGGLGPSDPLIPLRNRPQVALARSIVAILAAHQVRVPSHGPVPDADCRNLPLAVLAVLAQAGLLDRPMS